LLLLSLTLTISFKTYAEDITWNDLPKSAFKGLSLNEVFEDGNLIPLTFKYYQSTGNYTNDILTFYGNGVGTISYAYFNYTWSLNHKYYVNLYTKVVTTSSKIELGNNSGFTPPINVISPIIDTFYNFHAIITGVDDITTPMYLSSVYSTALLQADSTTIFKDMHFIDLTVLGLEDFTLEQMNLYYAEYIRYQDAYTLHYNDDANPLTILEKLWDLLITYSSIVSEFLFTEQTIGFEGINILGSTILAFNFSFVPFYAIGGGTVTTLLILYLGKKFLPFV